MNKENNYEKDISIDNTALDIEWLNQASLMMKYVKIAAQTRMEMTRAKENVDIVKAQLDTKIRANPELYGASKVTEPVVYNTILLQEEYTKANTRYLQASFEADMASGAVRAFDQKKSALENLVRLFNSSYFAGPSVPRDLNQEWEAKEKQKMVDRNITINSLKGRKIVKDDDEEEEEEEVAPKPIRRRKN